MIPTNPIVALSAFRVATVAIPVILEFEIFNVVNVDTPDTPILLENSTSPVNVDIPVTLRFPTVAIPDTLTLLVNSVSPVNVEIPVTLKFSVVVIPETFRLLVKSVSPTNVDTPDTLRLLVKLVSPVNVGIFPVVNVTEVPTRSVTFILLEFIIPVNEVAVTTPEIFTSPKTSSFTVGVVEPMPTKGVVPLVIPIFFVASSTVMNDANCEISLLLDISYFFSYMFIYYKHLWDIIVLVKVFYLSTIQELLYPDLN